MLKEELMSIHAMLSKLQERTTNETDARVLSLCRSNLEAAALGCNLLLSPIEPVKEYFGNLAHYSSPRAEDFPDLLRKLTGQPPRPELSRHIRNNYCESVLSQKLKALTIPEGFL